MHKAVNTSVKGEKSFLFLSKQEKQMGGGKERMWVDRKEKEIGQALES